VDLATVHEVRLVLLVGVSTRSRIDDQAGSRIHARRQATIGHAQLIPGDLVSTRVVHTQVHSPGAVSMHGDPRRRSEGGQSSARRAMMSRSQPGTAASWLAICGRSISSSATAHRIRCWPPPRPGSGHGCQRVMCRTCGMPFRSSPPKGTPVPGPSARCDPQSGRCARPEACRIVGIPRVPVDPSGTTAPN
jgi:hypothetical protein